MARSRRWFLGAAAGVVTAAVAGRRLVVEACRSIAASFERSAGSPSVDAETLDLLAAAAVTLLEHEKLDPKRYRDHLEWRARKFPEVARLYHELAARLRAESGVRNAGEWEGLAIADRRRALDDAMGRAGGRPVRLGPDRDFDGPDRFERGFVLGVVALYARTDAWRAIGYADYPGRARGLEAYTRTMEG